MSKLVIKRSQWLRGAGSHASYLRRERDGKMCCLGILGISLGATEEQLTNLHAPDQVREVNWTLGLFDANKVVSDVCMKLMMSNDSQDISERLREEKLTTLFSEIGIDVEFVD